jgi:protein-disulfide isomerase
MAAENRGHASVSPPAGINRGVAIVGFLLCFLAGAATFWVRDAQRFRTAAIEAEANNGPWSDAESPVPVTNADPIWGSRSAPVTIVAFSDFECPYCARVEPTLNQIKRAYTEEKVRIVWKNLPLQIHEKAKPAAEAAQAVFMLKGSAAFWRFHDTAFKNQAQLGPESYEKWAQAEGVDLAAFKQILEAKTATKKVDEDFALARRLGVKGTPMFLVNGKELAGAQPYEKFRKVIEEELKKANAKLAAGTTKDRLYVELSKETFKPPPPDPNAPEGEGEGEGGEENKEVASKNAFQIPIGKSPVLGKSDAPVTLVMFSDFECPYCKGVEPTVRSLREKYGDKLRVVFKLLPLPFHPHAEPASELALEARAQKGEQGFWDAHDRIFASQPKLDEADLEKIATDMGLDVAKTKAAIKEKKHAKDISADTELGEDMHCNGTPHFFINGRRLVGAHPIENFVKVIDEELQKFTDQKGKVSAANWYESIMKTAQGPDEPEKKTPPAVPAGSPFKGGKNAKVVIQEFSDFQCPYCSRAEPVLDEVMKNYGDKVKIVWRDRPLEMHAEAPLAAEAAREALQQKGPEGFWKMHDALYKNQEKLKREDLEGYAKEIGLDVGKFKTALDSHAHKAAVDADSKVATEMSIDGTPAFFINGYFFSGADSYRMFKRLIDRALAEAK